MKGFLITLVVIAALVTGGWAMGWLTFSDSKSKSALEIDKQKVEADTEKAASATKDATKKIAEETKDAIDSVRGETTDETEDSLKDGTEKQEVEGQDVPRDFDERTDE